MTELHYLILKILKNSKVSMSREHISLTLLMDYGEKVCTRNVRRIISELQGMGYPVIGHAGQVGYRFGDINSTADRSDIEHTINENYSKAYKMLIKARGLSKALTGGQLEMKFDNPKEITIQNIKEVIECTQ